MQNKCQLGNLTYPYNPPEDTNPRVKAVSLTETLSARYVTDWGTHPSRQDINQSWPTMDAAFFLALQNLCVQPGPLTFHDQHGVVYTVVALPPTYKSLVPGGDAYQDVKLTLHVLSQP